MAGDHLATDVALARRQTVRHEQQADQLIAGCWLDRDGDLVVVPADQRACLEDGPLATRVAQPCTETARGCGAGPNSHHLHHYHESAGCDLVEPVLPLPRGGGN